jgi:hypothetical protein
LHAIGGSDCKDNKNKRRRRSAKQQEESRQTARAGKGREYKRILQWRACGTKVGPACCEDGTMVVEFGTNKNRRFFKKTILRSESRNWKCVCSYMYSSYTVYFTIPYLRLFEN